MKKGCLLLIIIVIAKFVFAQSPTQGFFLDKWSSKNAVIPESVNHEKPSGVLDAVITIDALDTISKISPYVFGNNANTWSTIMYNNPGLVKHIKDMNPHVLRYPGGNLSNVFFWDLEANQRPEDMPQYVIDEHGLWKGRNPESWTMSVDNYYRFLDSVNCEGIICVNYAYARYGTSDDPVAKAAHYAADWVRYDNGRTKYWEIGNENFGNWQSGYQIETELNKDGQPEFINGRIYGQHSRVFIDSMKAAAAEIGHEIFIGVQAWESESSWDAIQTNWNELMMPEVGDLADFYILHNYYTPYDENSSPKTILDSYTLSEEFKESVREDLADAGFGPAPLALTEYNIFAVGSKQMVSHINGIHSVLVTGKLMEDEYGMANRWDLANGWDEGNDHGTFSRGGEPGVSEFEPRPVFYYLTYMQRYTGNVLVNSESANDDLIAFATTFDDGPLGIVVINKGDQNQTFSINTNNFSSGEKYYWYTLEGGDLEAGFSRQVVVNGHKPDRVAGGPSNYNSIEAFSSETSGGVILEAEPYTVHYLIVEGESEVDEESHLVTIQVNGMGLDAQTYPLGNAIVSIGSNTYQTDNSGMVSVNIEEGIHNISIRKSGYITLDEEIEVNESMSKTYTLQVESYRVEMQVKDVDSQQNIEKCKITVNGESQYSGTDGTLVFESLPADFTIDFEKEHYHLYSDPAFSIASDTTLIILAEKNNYLVEFSVKDIYTETGIWSVWVKVGNDSVPTNIQGKAYRELTFGDYDVVINSPSYNTVSTSIQITSDSAFTFYLKPLFADIKFRLKDGATPVNNAKININNDTLTSSATGIATFRDMNTDSVYYYTISKEGYNNIDDNLFLRRDTTLDIQMISTGINDELLQHLNVWPNPVNSEMNISGLPEMRLFSGAIINAEGVKVIDAKEVSSLKNKINTESLPAGVYLLKLYSGDYNFQEVFIKK